MLILNKRFESEGHKSFSKSSLIIGSALDRILTKRLKLPLRSSLCFTLQLENEILSLLTSGVR